MQRFRKDRFEALKFEGIIRSINARNPTGGHTEKDIEHAAQVIYNGEVTFGTRYTYIGSNISERGPEFPYMSAFKYFF